MLTQVGLAVFSQERGERFGGVRLPATPAAEPNSTSDSGRQPYAKGCRPRQHGTKGGGFAPRYYSATHIWASTTRTETLPPNRVVGVNTNTRWAPPAPTGRHPLPWWRAESLALEGRAVEGLIMGCRGN